MKRRAVAVLALTLAAAGLVAVALSATGSVVAPRPAPWATLAFARADAAGGGVYLADGRKVLRLRRVAVDPAWSPDGRRLAFVAPGAGGAGDVFVVDADGDHKAGSRTRTVSTRPRRAGRPTVAISSSSAAGSWSSFARREAEDDGWLRASSRPGRREDAESPSRTARTSTSSRRTAGRPGR
jgi:Tol biopolymer transport system component